MSTKKTAFGTDPERMAEMLRMATGAPPGDVTPEEEREELLGKRLRGSLPLTQRQAHDLAVLVGEFRERLPMQGRSIGEVILDEESDLGILVEIKEYGKALSTAAHSDADRDVGLTVYYAAIASAIVFRGRKITTHPFRALGDALGALVEKRWMDPRLSRLLAKARRACRKRPK